MLISKLKFGIVAVAAALLTTGAGVAAFQALAAPPAPAQKADNRAATVREQSVSEKEKEKQPRKLDDPRYELLT